MIKDLIAINHGTGKVDLRHLGAAALRMLPTELHLKEDGALNGKPSVCFVMETPFATAYGELSLEMWNTALETIGYKIEKI